MTDLSQPPYREIDFSAANYYIVYDEHIAALEQIKEEKPMAYWKLLKDLYGQA